MKDHVACHRKGFPVGLTEVTGRSDPSGIQFSILKLVAGEHYQLQSDWELAVLQLDGNGVFELNGQRVSYHRKSLFDQPPLAVHLPKDVSVNITALSDLELALFETQNDKRFGPNIYPPEFVGNEQKGKGVVDDAALRYVRTIFDGSVTDRNAQLVLGEVVNFPGRWSSYPPQHHPQPKLYHYRFADLRGYGHAELGDDVMKVRSFDTLRIIDEKDHAQCSAPGYAMYYTWVIRHLPSRRYTVPEFTDLHCWTMDPGTVGWQPKLGILR
jgi:5-deoxy-glucuronate isomerase